MNALPRVLRELFDPGEMVSLSEAALVVDRKVETVRGWVSNEWLGAKLAGRWAAHLPSILMFMDHDRKALNAFQNGDKSSPLVAGYFARAAHLKSTVLKRGAR